jgi:hypothetical protein
MILKIAIAIAVVFVAVVCIPSLIATCTLLAKGISDLGVKRQRRAALYRR